MRNSDAFVMSVISLAFALKSLVESKYYDESKHKLVQDFTKLKERVQFHTRILEEGQACGKVQTTAKDVRLNQKGGMKA